MLAIVVQKLGCESVAHTKAYMDIDQDILDSKICSMEK